MKKYNVFTLFIALIWLHPLYGLDKEITINVDAGRQECFFQLVKLGDTIDIEYQVIDGGHGDLDISFELTEPGGRILFADFKKSDNMHRHEARIEGDYRFCFDNRFSNFNRKTVFFELIVENDSSEGIPDIGITPEEFYDIQVKDIQEYVTRIRGQLMKARQMQDMLRSYEARDRNIAEENHFKVNAWSFFQICAMIAIGGLQVFMVRSIFDTDSKMYRVWKKLNL